MRLLCESLTTDRQTYVHFYNRDQKPLRMIIYDIPAKKAHFGKNPTRYRSIHDDVKRERLRLTLTLTCANRQLYNILSLD